MALLDTKNILSTGCQGQFSDCITDCGDEQAIYRSLEQDSLIGNGFGPISRYLACVNLPSIARYWKYGQLSSNTSNAISRYIDPNTSESQLQNITEAVTGCVSSTCQNSRRPDLCYADYCSPVKLLSNSSAPNVTAINQCMHILCSNGYKSLPFADADIVGIGVYASYILQCMYIAILWLGFMYAAVRSRRKHSPGEPDLSNHRKAWINLLNEFHKVQCFFSTTLMIASFTQRIYDSDMLVIFMLVPLATNGIVPIVFAYLLLIHYKRLSPGSIFATLLVYIVSSIVYWILYSQISSLSPVSDQAVYQQFMFKLSAIEDCGGYSALAACPRLTNIGLAQVTLAATRIRILTPLIWSLSTIVLLALLSYQAYFRRLHPAPNDRRISSATPINGEQAVSMETSRTWKLAFVVMTAVMIACLGMQFSLLTISYSLNMMDSWDWPFGQVIAVTVWTPPVLEYFYGEISECPLTLPLDSAMAYEMAVNKVEARKLSKMNKQKVKAESGSEKPELSN